MHTTRSPRPLTRRATLIGALAGATALPLSSCRSGTPSADPNAPFSVMLPLFETEPASDAGQQAAIEELIGRDLAVSWIAASSYGDRLTVTLASDDIPQMIETPKDANFIRAAQAGAYWEVGDLLGDYEFLSQGDAQVTRASAIDGSVFGLYRWRDPMRAAAILRQDWLDALELDVPETVDDLRTVAEAFVTERPGGSANSGLAMNTWGTAGWGSDSPYDYVPTWFGAPNGWGEQGGKLVPAFDTEEYLEACRFLREMREKGFLNADFATIDPSEVDSRFFGGTAGIALATDDFVPKIAGLFEERDPGQGASYVGDAGNLVGPDGTRHAHPTIGYNGLLAFPRQSVPDEETLRRLLGYMDELDSPEGQRLLAIGVEGENYTMEGDFVVPVEAKEASSQFQQMSPALAGSTVPAVKPETEQIGQLLEVRDQLRERDLEDAVYNPAAGLISSTQAEQGVVLGQIIGDARTKFIDGQLSESDLLAEHKRWHTSGGDAISAELTEAYEAL